MNWPGKDDLEISVTGDDERYRLRIRIQIRYLDTSVENITRCACIGPMFVTPMNDFLPCGEAVDRGLEAFQHREAWGVSWRGLGDAEHVYISSLDMQTVRATQI